MKYLKNLLVPLFILSSLMASSQSLDIAQLPRFLKDTIIESKLFEDIVIYKFDKKVDFDNTNRLDKMIWDKYLEDSIWTFEGSKVIDLGFHLSEVESQEYSDTTLRASENHFNTFSDIRQLEIYFKKGYLTISENTNRIAFGLTIKNETINNTFEYYSFQVIPETVDIELKSRKRSLPNDSVLMSNIYKIKLGPKSIWELDFTIKRELKHKSSKKEVWEHIHYRNKKIVQYCLISEEKIDSITVQKLWYCNNSKNENILTNEFLSRIKTEQKFENKIKVVDAHPAFGIWYVDVTTYYRDSNNVVLKKDDGHLRRKEPYLNKSLWVFEDDSIYERAHYTEFEYDNFGRLSKETLKDRDKIFDYFILYSYKTNNWISPDKFVFK